MRGVQQTIAGRDYAEGRSKAHSIFLLLVILMCYINFFFSVINCVLSSSLFHFEVSLSIRKVGSYYFRSIILVNVKFGQVC